MSHDVARVLASAPQGIRLAQHEPWPTWFEVENAAKGEVGIGAAYDIAARASLRSSSVRISRQSTSDMQRAQHGPSASARQRVHR